MNSIQNKIISENWKPHDIGNIDHLFLLPKLHPRKCFIDNDSESIKINLIDFFPVYLIIDMFGRKPTNSFIRQPNSRDETPFYYFSCIQ